MGCGVRGAGGPMRCRFTTGTDHRCSITDAGVAGRCSTSTPAPRSPAQLVLVLRGIWQGTPPARLGCDRKHLLELRHKLQGLAAVAASQTGPVLGSPTEADEMFQNAGE